MIDSVYSVSFCMLAKLEALKAPLIGLGGF